MHGTGLVLLEVLIVIGLATAMGWLCRFIRQPLVTGEILAGILLGPSFLGLIAPDFLHHLFPDESRFALEVLSQVGLIFFMFLIGLELNPKYLKGQLKTAVLISNISVIVPFVSAFFLSAFLYTRIEGTSIPLIPFAFFMGSAMSITAFPVLARIITEFNLSRTRLGTLALTCAAVDDITAWCLLAMAIAITRTGSIVSALPLLFKSLVYLAFMFTLGRWAGEQLFLMYRRSGKLNRWLLALIYAAVVSSAIATEWIGIHLIFGAFVVGVILPKHSSFIQEIAEKTEDFVLIFLLPIFFVYSGLKTEVGLLNSPYLWGLTLLVIGTAVAGKYFGTYITARFCRLPHWEASALGWLMNTRGLTELIVLNIGLNLGVITPVLFTMLVLMALTTTFMTSPLLAVTIPPEAQGDLLSPEPVVPEYRLLVPIINPQTQRRLLEMAGAIAGGDRGLVQTLSLVELEEDYFFSSTPEAVNRLIRQRRQVIGHLLEELGQQGSLGPVQPIIRISNDVARDTTQIALVEAINLILIGPHRSTFGNHLLGGRVGQVLNGAPVDVAVYLEPEPRPLNHLLVPYGGSSHDDLSLALGLRLLLQGPHRRLTLWRSPDYQEWGPEAQGLMNHLPATIREQITVETMGEGDPFEQLVIRAETVDLVVAGTRAIWGTGRQTLAFYSDRLARRCSVPLLIVRRHSRELQPHIPPLSVS